MADHDISFGYPPGFEIGYTPLTSPVNITDTSESTATALITAGEFVFDGGPVWVEFFAEEVFPPTGTSAFLAITLFEGSTQITRLAVFDSVAAANPPIGPCVGRYRFTPAAGRHTYKVCGFVSGTTGTPHIRAGAGGTAADAPAFIRFTKV